MGALTAAPNGAAVLERLLAGLRRGWVGEEATRTVNVCPLSGGTTMGSY